MQRVLNPLHISTEIAVGSVLKPHHRLSLPQSHLQVSLFLIRVSNLVGFYIDTVPEILGLFMVYRFGFQSLLSRRFRIEVIDGIVDRMRLIRNI